MESICHHPILHSPLLHEMATFVESDVGQGLCGVESGVVVRETVEGEGGRNIERRWGATMIAAPRDG